MTASNNDMATMPIPNLINAIRVHANKLPEGQVLTAMVLNILCNRMEQQEKTIEALKLDLRLSKGRVI